MGTMTPDDMKKLILYKSLFEKKEAFKKAGFTEEQAFELVKTIIESM